MRPALATFGLLLAFLLGFIVNQNLFNQTPQVAEQNTKFENEIPQVLPTNEAAKNADEATEKTTKSTTSDILKTTENKTPQNFTPEKRPLLQTEKVKPNLVEVKKSEPKSVEPSNSEKSFESTEIAENVEVKKFPIVEKREDTETQSNTTRSVVETGKSLKNIKYVFVEVSGDDKYGRQLGEQLMDKLNANKRFLAVNNREKADGLLKVSVRREHDNGNDENTIVSAIVRLVNADGFVVFPNKKRVSGWKYVGNATKIPSQIVKDLAGQK